MTSISLTSVFLRSLVYQVLFYALLVFWLLVAIPTFLMPPRAILFIAKTWSRQSVVLLRWICGVKFEVRGTENIPAGSLVVAAKHQSMWETFALLPFFDSPLFIYKRELGRIPFFGWYLRLADMIDVNRAGGVRALMDMAKRARNEVQKGRQLIIFPEGTRRPVGAPPDYKSGVAQIYALCHVPCLPVALNSGLFWPRRTFLRYPGTLVVEFMPPLPSGLQREEFLATIREKIETATDRIVAEARAEQAEIFGRVPDVAVKEK